MGAQPHTIKIEMIFLFVTHITKSLSTPTEPNPTPKMSITVCNSSTRENSKCKVCFDAKKDEKMYMGHRTKNEMGVVICPTLTNQACLRCNKKGHTVSRCTVKLEKRVSTPDKSVSIQAPNAPKKIPRQTMYFHRMTELELDSDDEECERANVNVSLQLKGNGKHVTFHMNKMSYAAIVAQSSNAGVVAAVALDSVIKPVLKQVTMMKPKTKLNWADMDSDSDSE